MRLVEKLGQLCVLDEKYSKKMSYQIFNCTKVPLKNIGHFYFLNEATNWSFHLFLMLWPTSIHS